MTAPVDVWTIYSEVISFLAEGIGELIKFLTDAINNLDLEDLEPVIESIGASWDIISESVVAFCHSLPHVTIIIV